MIAKAMISTGLALLVSFGAQAADLKVLLPLSFQHTMKEVAPRFEATSGNKVSITYGTAGAVAARVKNGEAADVLVSTSAQIDALEKSGKVSPNGKVRVVKVGVGLLVRKGAPKPDVSSVESLKTSLLASKGIAYTDPALGGPAGIYVARLLDQLGIGAAMKAKTRLAGPGAEVSTAVVNGEAEIGFIMINEIVVDSRVDYVGPLPAPVQDYTNFAGGVVAGSVQDAVAGAFLQYLTAPETQTVFAGVGFEAP